MRDYHYWQAQDSLRLLDYTLISKILRRNKSIAYDILKGQGAGGESRSKAKCSGLAQAAVTGQQFKDYVVDGKNIRIKSLIRTTGLLMVSSGGLCH